MRDSLGVYFYEISVAELGFEKFSRSSEELSYFLFHLCLMVLASNIPSYL